MSSPRVDAAPGPPGGLLLPAPASAYWPFYREVAVRQVQGWAPRAPSCVLDLSGERTGFSRLLAEQGHRVLHVCRTPSADVPTTGPGEVLPVRADPTRLDWLRDGAVDAVLAESTTLSSALATEVAVAELRRVLRPGGRLLVVVESLVLGLARLADAGRWAELADVPRADVVIVPGPDGALTRCFAPEELRGLLTDNGFDVTWVRPRTALTPSAVERALAEGGPRTLATLVESELALEPTGELDGSGLFLAASAVRAQA